MSCALTIGLTGGIASGKSAVEHLFHEQGVPVLDADRVARQVVEPGEPALAQIVEAFGTGMLTAAGSLDRRALRQIVFEDAAARRRLEAITHPRIRRAMQDWRERIDSPYCIISIPLLAEGGRNPMIDRVLVVDAPAEVQLRRLMQRDGIDEALARRMIESQASREERLRIADEVILNDGGFDRLRPAVLALDERYRRLAAMR